MSMLSWAYPDDPQPMYHFDTAAALGYFKAAGYEQRDGVLQKDGKRLTLEVGIAGNGLMRHPAAPILVTMKNELERLGGELVIQDVAGSVLYDRLHAGLWDVWVAGWQTSLDPDMYEMYHTSGSVNFSHLSDPKLDELITLAREAQEIPLRRGYYLRAEDIIMSHAVEMPVYQRKSLTVFNSNVVDVGTIAKDVTPFYGYANEIEKLEFAA